MAKLAPNFFDRRFDDLVEIGRSLLPSLAPQWTDYNLHDPGITLMELLAWVAEAQIYSLSKMRRDERAAYGALFGLVPRGPQPACGLIWPVRSDAMNSIVIDADAVVYAEKSETPMYRTTWKLLWVAGRIQALCTLGADGSNKDHTATNEHGSIVFEPFGEHAGPRDVLRLDYRCTGEGGLFPARRVDADGAYLTIGIRADTFDDSKPDACADTALAITLLAGSSRHALEILADSSLGFMRTGAIILDVSMVPGSPREFTLEFRSPRGFARPPRILHIELNVLPICQSRLVERELHMATGLPDQVIELREGDLQFGAGAPALKVEVTELGASRTWEAHEQLADCSPEDPVYTLAPAASRITFGNGINGRLPVEGAQIFVTYPVCDGAMGNSRRNRRWIVHGIQGVFGVNPDPIIGGADALGSLDHRREARRRAREEHALVTSADLEAAARSLPVLEVARAWAVTSRSGLVTLIAMRARPNGNEPAEVPESTRWLANIKRCLGARIPLGSQLIVRRPRYVGFRVAARLEALEKWDPNAVANGVTTALQERLALVAPQAGATERSLGVDMTRRDVAAWIRKVPGVLRVTELKLILDTGKIVEEISVGQYGLPRIDLTTTQIAVERSTRSR